MGCGETASALAHDSAGRRSLRVERELEPGQELEKPSESPPAVRSAPFRRAGEL